MMKQIDKIARELKGEFAGRYNHYYKSAVIYLDTEENCLRLIKWGQGESFIEHPKYLIPLCSYAPMYGNWCEYGSKNKWCLTKKVIAKDIEEGIEKLGNSDEYFGKISIPDWLKEEIAFYH